MLHRASPSRASFTANLQRRCRKATVYAHSSGERRGGEVVVGVEVSVKRVSQDNLNRPTGTKREVPVARGGL